MKENGDTVIRMNDKNSEVYYLLLEFLIDQCDFTQAAIAKKLSISPSTVSRIMQSTKPSEKPRYFGERVFMKIFKDQKVFPEYEKLYNYLTENGVVTEEINQAYHQVHDKNAPTEKDREDFYRAVVKKADADMRDRLEGKTDQPAFTFAPWQPDPVENFVGRAETLKNIKKKLDDKGLAIIAGMGGMGKSQTALQYAKNNEKYYRGGMQQVSFEESLSTTLLSIKKDDDSQKTPAQQMQDLMQNLRQLAAPSLLIIDNVDTELAGDDMAILKELIQMDLHVLITSRNTKLYDPAYMIPLSAMDETDQMELFRNNYRPDFSKNPEDFQLPEKDIPGFRKIISLVQGHTMMIELIAKTMQGCCYNPRKMYRYLTENRDTDQLKIEVQKDNKYEQEGLYNTISTLFNLGSMKDESRQIMEKLALCSIKGIRKSFFDSFLLDGNSSPEISRLENMSWIIRDSAAAADDTRIHLHPVIRSVVLGNLKPTLAGCRDYLCTVIDTYGWKEEQPKNDEVITAQDRQDVCDILIEAGNLFQAEYDTDSAELLLKQAEIIFSAHQYRAASRQCDLVLRICRENKCSLCRQLLPRVQKLRAAVAMRQGDYKTAIENYMDAIKAWEQEAQPPHEAIADTFNQLANVCRKDSQYQLALENFEKARDYVNGHRIRNDALLADILNNLGIVYLNMGNLDEALKNYEAGMDLREKMEPRDKKQLAYSYHNIGTVYQKKDKFDEAIKWHKKAQELRKEIYTKQDPTYAESLTMLGNDYAGLASEKKKAGRGWKADEKRAGEYIEEGLKIRENALGSGHPAVAWSYHSLGMLAYQSGHFEKAAARFRKCLEIRRKSLGNAHSYTAEALYWLGLTERELQQIPEAVRHLKEAYAIYSSESKGNPSRLGAIRDLLAQMEPLKKRNEERR